MLKTKRFFNFSVYFLLLVCVVATYHKIFVHGGNADNNLKTYLASYNHLIHNLDMYLAYPAEHGDFFKYTPTFGLFIWPYTLFPYLVAAVLFNLMNLVIFLWGIVRLPIEQKDKNLFLWVAVPELMGAIQNFQTNAMLAGLFLLAYSGFRKSHFGSSLVSLAVAFFTKIFAGALVPVGFAAAQTSRKRWQYVGLTAAIFAFFFILPAFFVGFDKVIWQYQNYLRLQGHDNAEQPAGYYSLMHVVGALSGWSIKNIYFQIAGVLAVLIPLVTRPAGHLWKTRPHALFASAVLFMLVFNHRSESETFIIGMIGFLVWWVGEPRSRWMWGLLALNFICASVLYGDLLTEQQKIAYLEPAFVKIWGILIAWFVIEYQIWGDWLRATVYSVPAVPISKEIA